MPIILPPLPDPTDLVLAGEQMRASVLDLVSAPAQAAASVSITAGFSSMVPDEDAFPPMNNFIDGNRLGVRRGKDGILQIRSGAGISTPCGAWVFLDWAPLLQWPHMGTDRFQLSGVTRDNTGATLGAARVVAMRTEQIVAGGSPVVGETVSDGAGNYAIEVPTNSPYQVLAYKQGAPDVAGASVNTLAPITI